MLEKGPITLYIHGTIFPVVAKFTKHHIERKGLYKLTATDRITQGKALSEADPKRFPSGSFYKYYWCGNLDADARKKAADEIFKLLASHEGPITIIAHSHGCNVALYLAEIAKKNKSSFKVDSLILLAPPVQETTSHLIRTSFFTRIYSFYSHADFMQIADPQGLYKQQKKSGTPLLSKRTYANSSQLSQARVLIRQKGPGHRDFIRPDFFKQIPDLIDLLDESYKQGKQHILVNIPQLGKPHELVLAQTRKPRGIDHCSRVRHTKATKCNPIMDATSYHV